MTTTLRGHFQPRRSDLRDTFPSAPFASAILLHNDRLAEVDFLVDTGADSTVLSPQDAVLLFGIQYYQELWNRKPLIPVTGIGAGVSVEEDIQLVLFDHLGAQASFHHTVSVMDLALNRDGDPINWSMPSLLGRDLLQLFRLEISFQPPLIELTTVADE